jgi:hypothetical protein
MAISLRPVLFGSVLPPTVVGLWNVIYRTRQCRLVVVFCFPVFQQKRDCYTQRLNFCFAASIFQALSVSKLRKRPSYGKHHLRNLRHTLLASLYFARRSSFATFVLRARSSLRSLRKLSLVTWLTAVSICEYLIETFHSHVPSFLRLPRMIDRNRTCCMSLNTCSIWQ